MKSKTKRVVSWVIAAALAVAGTAGAAALPSLEKPAAPTQTIYVATYSATTSGGGVSISTDGGANWKTYTMANGLGSNSVNHVVASGSTVYAATWPLVTFPATSQGPESRIATEKGGGLSISTNGGKTWKTYTTANGLGSNFVHDVFVSGSTIYAATEGLHGTAGGLSISRDGGKTWETHDMTNGLGRNVVTSVFVSGATIYCGTDNGLFVSTNGGASWTSYTTDSGLGSNSVEGVFVSGTTIYAATRPVYGSKWIGGLSVSKDGGTSWTNYSAGNGLVSDSILGVFASGSSIYAAAVGGLSVSSDGGASWTNYTMANGLGGLAVSGVFVSGSAIYAALGGAAGFNGSTEGLSVSTNGGASWKTYTVTNGLGSNTVLGVYVQ